MPDRPERRPLARSDRALIVIALVVLIGGGYWLLRTPDVPAPTPPAETAPPAPETAEAPAPQPGDLPPAKAEEAPALLETVSADPTFRRWLGAGGLVERWAAITENVASGASPRRHLPFLRPERPFSVVERGGRKVIAPASYARYDAVGDAIASVDAAALARVYRALHGPLDAAYRALGYPAGALDRATTRALERLAGAPVREGDVEVVDEGGIYLFADPSLERLGEIDKHLLRMGPRNARIVREKAREIQAALGLAKAEPAPAR